MQGKRIDSSEDKEGGRLNYDGLQCHEKKEDKMDGDKFYVKNRIVRRLNDKIPRTE
jgi:hypothetical protein